MKMKLHFVIQLQLKYFCHRSLLPGFVDRVSFPGNLVRTVWQRATIGSVCESEMTTVCVHNVKTVCYAFKRLPLDSQRGLPYERGDDSTFVIHMMAFPPIYAIREKPVGQGTAQAVSRWLLVAEVRATSHSSPCGICGEQSDADASLSPCTCRFSLSIITTLCYIISSSIENWYNRQIGGRGTTALTLPYSRI
jgi:hypothetical protein